MKEIKLKRVNSQKYCIDCKETVNIKMDGLVGRCPNCGRVLYIIDNSKKTERKIENEI